MTYIDYISSTQIAYKVIKFWSGPDPAYAQLLPRPVGEVINRNSNETRRVSFTLPVPNLQLLLFFSISIPHL